MRKFDDYPKAFKKMVRFIRQEATLEQIRGMEHIFVDTVALRLQKLEPDCDTRNRNLSRKSR
jgi:hypothetical protein